jgi:hypothetical protein
MIVAAVRILIIATTLTAAAFALAIYLRHIGTPAEFLAWVREAGHGEGRDRQALRMLFGLPRAFFIMGDDGSLWKQFLFRDPYAHIGLWDALRASAWKIALFYGVMCLAAVELVRRDRWMALWAAAGVVPTLALAVAFEAGSVERYFALYPAVFVGLAWGMSQRSRPVLRVASACFCVVLVATNLQASWRPTIDQQRAHNLGRLSSVCGGKTCDSASMVYVLNFRDPIYSLYDPNDRSLDSIPRIKYLIPGLASEIRIWRSMFAHNILQAWDMNGEVWVSKRVWAERPLPEWCWVEGDDRSLRWKEIGPVLSRFHTDHDAGGPDGFQRIAGTPENRAMALSLISGERP